VTAKRRVQGTGVTGQTVLDIARRFEPEQLDAKESPAPKRECRILYIEADEDHVVFSGFFMKRRIPL